MWCHEDKIMFDIKSKHSEEKIVLALPCSKQRRQLVADRRKWLRTYQSIIGTMALQVSARDSRRNSGVLTRLRFGLNSTAISAVDLIAAIDGDSFNVTAPGGDGPIHLCNYCRRCRQ